jgi:NAD(P)-dependent dehydrogenase (short-subunit alcohol dehydrogenase family)
MPSRTVENRELRGATMGTIVITGGTGAVGGAAARALVQGGHHVVLLGRDPARLQGAVRSFPAPKSAPAPETVRCDLASLASVRAAAADLAVRCPRIDALVNCAAVFVRERKTTPEGQETMLVTNHLGPFLLTNLLLDRLHGSAPSRVVTVSAPSTTEIDFDDLQGERKWGAFTQFGRTKMANLLFAYSLARREEPAQMTSNVLFPGLVRSGLMKDANAAVRGLSGMMSKPPEAAGSALAWLAVDPSLRGATGKFYKLTKLDETNAYSHDAQVQDRLWSESAGLVGLGRPSS